MRPGAEAEASIATAGQRVLAYSIDYLVIAALEVEFFRWLPVSTPGLDRLLAWTPPSLDDPVALQRASAALEHALAPLLTILVLAQLAIEIVYFIAAERLTGGRSIGKWLIRLRVVTAGGAPPTLVASTVRNLLRPIDELPASYLLGFLVMLASRRRQRLGDLAAGTVVRHEPRRSSVASASAPPP